MTTSTLRKLGHSNKDFYHWPNNCTMNFYEEDGTLFASEKTRKKSPDLADLLAENGLPDHQPVTLFITIQSESARRAYWDEDTICHLEARIKYDLEFDGLVLMDIKRETWTGMGRDEEFRWRLLIRDA